MLKENDRMNAQVYEIQSFCDHLQKISGVIEKYDYNLMRQTVRKITVFRDRTVEVEFFSGEKVKIKI